MMSPNNPIYSHAPRDYQTVRCCGKIYRRWRFKGRKTFRHGKRFLHATHCKECGHPLNWPVNFEPQLTASVRKKERVEKYYDQKVEWRLAGKNSLGKPWGRTPTFLTAEARLQARRQRGTKAWKKRVERMKRLGLTTRGTAPKYRQGIAKLWRDVRQTIIIPENVNFESINSGNLKR